MNMPRRLRIVPLACAFAALVWCGAVQGAQAGVVATLAGSGLPGIADGAHESASFLMPVSLAYDRAGNLIVVDSAAQRVRRVRPNGTVETIAGSGMLAKGTTHVAGGFADGAGPAARFNWPSGIAVAKDGTIYVADTGNHCIRAISSSGRVSVYAGSPARAGRELGSRRTATFTTPMGLAVDAKGDLYVADPAAGLRKIDADGNVTAVPLGHNPTGVSIGEAGGLTMYVVDRDGILIAYPDGRHWRLRSLNQEGSFDSGASLPDPPGTVERDMAMQRPVGYAQSLTVLPGDQIFFADPRANTIRYAFPAYAFSETLAGSATEDAAGEGAGYRDGANREARFNGPLGTAASADGSTIAIADAGNRRVRLLRIDVPRDLVQQATLVPLGDAPENAYRILYLGPSWTWYDSTGSDSISSRLEEQLQADGALASAKLVPNVRFFGGVGSLDPIESVARTVADLGIDKLVLLDVTELTIQSNMQTELTEPATWQTTFSSRLRAADAILRAAHVRFVVDIHPFPLEFSANEYPLSRMGLPALGTGRIPETRLRPLLRQAVLAAGVELIDTYPDFQDEARHPSAPMTGTVDSHYSVFGRAVLARAIAHGLEKLAPWASER